MALVSVAGVTAHQLIKAGPRRTRAGRHDAVIARMVEHREFRARKDAVAAARAEIDAHGGARLVFTPTRPAPADAGISPDSPPGPAAAPDPDTATAIAAGRDGGREPDTPADTRADASPATAPDTRADPAADAPADPDPAPRRAPARTRRGPSTADRVARMRARHPGETAAEIAARLKLSDRTVRRHWTAPRPDAAATAA
jgi:hypothetical protein